MSKWTTEQETGITNPLPRSASLSAGARLIDQAGMARDGRITAGEVVAMVLALGLFVIVGLSIGLSAAILTRDWSYLLGGVAAGAGVGGTLVAIRATADLLRLGVKQPIEDPVEIDVLPHEPKGFEIWLRSPSGKQWKRGQLLPDLPTEQVRAMLRKLAIAYYLEGQNLSRRGAGAAFGEHWGDALVQLERAGVLVRTSDSDNAKRELTEIGDAWLKERLG